MKRTKRILLAMTLAGAITLTPAAFAAGQMPVTVAYAHGHGGWHHGGSTTSYYYCGGHSAHTHSNGICPYTTTSTSSTSYYYCGGHSAHQHHNGACPYAAYTNQSTVKSVQRALNQCGYNCGTADGVYGTKTKKAIKRFQRANNLTVDGVIGKKTLKALGLV